MVKTVPEDPGGLLGFLLQILWLGEWLSIVKKKQKKYP